MQVRAAAIQMACVPGDVAGNLDRADAYLARCRDEGVELAVLPELFNTGYCSRGVYGPIAEDLGGPTLSLLRDRSRRVRGDSDRHKQNSNSRRSSDHQIAKSPHVISLPLDAHARCR